MNKDRRSKSLIIVALALTLMVLTVGFAAFSETLSISSSATVTPNEEDFKITIYGFNSLDAALDFEMNGTVNDADLSTTLSYPSPSGTGITGTTALIDNSTHTISNISVSLTKPATELVYYFVVKNEGKYDAYIDLSSYEANDGEYLIINPGTCVAGKDTTDSLVQATCENVLRAIGITNADRTPLENNETIMEIPKGEYIYLAYLIGYMDTENLADGPFTVSFDELQLSFTTAK